MSATAPKTKTFSKLSAAQKRIVVAKDALAQLRMKTMRALPGTYIDMRDRHGRSLDAALQRSNTEWSDQAHQYCETEATPAADVQKLVLKRAKRCHVCAKGAAAICTIRAFDSIDGDDFAELADGTMDPITRIFPQQMLDKMESAFEVEDAIEDGHRPKDFSKANPRGFGVRYKDPDKRLAAIFRNIVRNKGSFKP